MDRLKTATGALAAVALSLSTLSCGLTSELTEPEPGPDSETAPPRPASPETTSTTDLVEPVENGWSAVPEVVEEVTPAVVAISVATAEAAGEGSGVIIRADGLIVTNAHVVGAASEVEVVLADGTRLPGTVEATDAFTDLALVRVDRQDLPALTLAEDYPELGELVIAVGNPLGFDNTVTAGIVSGLQRSIPEVAAGGSQPALVDLIQTDAAISPGNSGGALVDSEGRLIGITVAYIPPSIGAVSLGFAIPAPTVDHVVTQLLETGEVAHPYLGVQLATVTPQIAEQLDLATARGAAVIGTEPGAAADEAGIESGDVVVAVDDQSVESVGDFLTLLRGYVPGDVVELVVERDGEEETFAVELGSRPTAGAN